MFDHMDVIELLILQKNEVVEMSIIEQYSSN